MSGAPKQGSRMDRLALAFCTLLLGSSFVGCGMSDPPPPADKSNMPDEVKAEEEKFEANNAKRAAAAQKRAGKGAGH